MAKRLQEMAEVAGYIMGEKAVEAANSITAKSMTEAIRDIIMGRVPKKSLKYVLGDLFTPGSPFDTLLLNGLINGTNHRGEVVPDRFRKVFATALVSKYTMWIGLSTSLVGSYIHYYNLN
jgi:hypothetical protein|tara:strand:- start:8666 stop:9025 length:360 start_codon:yes stop_codon:yes gene_type:complete